MTPDQIAEAERYHAIQSDLLRRFAPDLTDGLSSQDMLNINFSLLAQLALARATNRLAAAIEKWTDGHPHQG